MVGGHAVGAALYVEAIEHVVLHDCIVAGCVARGGDAGRGGGGVSADNTLATGDV